MAESSPMMEQYRRIKNEHRDEILFFRLGDFYEMFSDDAIEVSGLLNLTLTSRNGQPMCGIPFHASRSYISRLLKLDKKVAICEQITLAGTGRGIVERRVVEVITPGTTVEEDYLDIGEANYLAALACQRDCLSFAYIDVSSGGFFVTTFPRSEATVRLRKELERLQARELIVQESLIEGTNDIATILAERSGLIINRWSDWLFDASRSAERLTMQFKTVNLIAFGINLDSPELLAAGAILAYLDDTAQSLLPHISTIKLYRDEDYVSIDESSQRNLELIRNMRDGEKRYSLLEVMDETMTPMGLRLLKWRILHPSRDRTIINDRLDSVDILYRNQKVSSDLRGLLSRILDLERLSSRIAMDKAHGKDLAALRDSLGAYDAIINLTRPLGLIDKVAGEMGAVSPDCAQRLAGLRGLLEQAIADEPSILLSEGGIIKEGFNNELDALRELKDNGRRLLEAYLEEERRSTGIQSLKIKYNRLIGYYFEVTKSNLDMVPMHFIRRQGITGGERYTTNHLSGLESEINSAADKTIELERRLFLKLRDDAKALIPDLFTAARIVAALDVAQSSTRTATSRVWTRPILTDGSGIKIQEGRHPVVEAHMSAGEFIPNNVAVDAGGTSFVLITGPNMAGKSTYLRQTALIAIMAQIGSFVPARQAEIALIDKVFCRVGAQDNLARGESTFLVEMNETAHILRTASERSLVIMDEVGRGTGTHDGLSLAWAICEELLRITCCTLFATHYHELSELKHPRLVNRSMDVMEKDGEVIFLKRIRDGATAESFGIHVARLAGLPDPVVDRARDILGEIRSKPHGYLSPTLRLEKEMDKSATSQDRLGQRFIQEFKTLDPDRMTPLEALSYIEKWKTLLNDNQNMLNSDKKTGKSRINIDKIIQKEQLLFPE